jgi:hypothetical protein
LSASVRTLSIFDRDLEIQDVLAELNPKLAEVAQSGNEFEFGLYYGKRVEFEYAVTFASTAASRVLADSPRQSPVETAGSSSLRPTLNRAVGADTLHGVIEVSMSRYKEWLSEVSARRLDQGKVSIRSRE